MTRPKTMQYMYGTCIAPFRTVSAQYLHSVGTVSAQHHKRPQQHRGRASTTAACSIAFFAQAARGRGGAAKLAKAARSRSKTEPSRTPPPPMSSLDAGAASAPSPSASGDDPGRRHAATCRDANVAKPPEAPGGSGSGPGPRGMEFSPATDMGQRGFGGARGEQGLRGIARASSPFRPGSELRGSRSTDRFRATVAGPAPAVAGHDAHRATLVPGSERWCEQREDGIDRSASPSSLANALLELIELDPAAGSGGKASDLPHLPPEFRIQLHMWDCLSRHTKMLDKLGQRQSDTTDRLASLCDAITSGQLSRGEAELDRRLARHFSGLRADLAAGQHAVVSHIDTALNGLDERRDWRSPSADRLAVRKASSNRNISSPSADMDERQSATLSAITALMIPEDEPSGFRRLVRSAAFDILCGVVISLNVAVICVQAEQAMEWALQHVGEGAGTESPLSIRLNYFFVGFYTFEILLKLAGLKCDFWRGEDWKWNVFDLVLVLFAWYDLFADKFFSDTRLNQTWLRGLRLLKMFKMLRVVRVMRFFRELRNMIAAIVGSFTTLIWAILAISLMMFVFGLALINGISTFLTDTDPTKIPEALMEDIRWHWGSVPAAVLTLYKATSGGSDWEPLAAPLVEAGAMYYAVFLAYIALSTIAVLNVVTGIFVDAAMTVVGRDAQLVLEEIYDRNEIKALRVFLRHEDPAKSGMLSGTTLRQLIADKDKHLGDFLKVVQLDFNDAMEVFVLLSANNMLDIEEFISGCMRLRADLKGIDTIAISSSVKRFAKQFEVTMEYVDEEFQKLRESLHESRPEGALLKDRLKRARCLPLQWGTGGIGDTISMSLRGAS